jgi:hypothetical protein
VVALIVVALRLPKSPGRPATTAAPSAWLVLAAALVAGAIFEVGFDTLPTWLTIPAILVPEALMIAAVLGWSARSGWNAGHRLALAAGALLTYAWHSFEMHPVVTSSASLTLVSHVVFAVGALALLIVATFRNRDGKLAGTVQSAPRGTEFPSVSVDAGLVPVEVSTD